MFTTLKIQAMFFIVILHQVCKVHEVISSFLSFFRPVVPPVISSTQQQRGSGYSEPASARASQSCCRERWMRPGEKNKHCFKNAPLINKISCKFCQYFDIRIIESLFFFFFPPDRNLERQRNSRKYKMQTHVECLAEGRLRDESLRAMPWQGERGGGQIVYYLSRQPTELCTQAPTMH